MTHRLHRSIVGHRHHLAGYSLVGVIGFAIDATLITVLTVHLGMTLLAGRCISFSAATLVTWLLNRRIVFLSRNDSRSGMYREYARYLVVQVAGAVTNLTVFFALVRAFPQLAAVPAVPLAAGALCALAITYVGARRFVFSAYDNALEPANER